MKKTILTAGVALIALSGAVFAGSHAGNPAVKARQAHMTLYSFHAGYLGAVARGRADYDAGAAQAAADAFAALVVMDQSRMWPADTDEMSIEGTRAKAELWGNFPKVMEISGQLRDAAMNLQSVASNGQEAVGGAMGAVFGACTACHDAFRVPAN